MVAKIRPVKPVITTNQKYKIASLLWLVVKIQSAKNEPTLDVNKTTSRRTFQKKIKVLILHRIDSSGAPNFEPNSWKQEKALALKKAMIPVTFDLDISLPRQLTIGYKSKDTSNGLYRSYK